MEAPSPDAPDSWLHFLRSNVATACNLFVLTCQKGSKGMYQQGINATARCHQLLNVMNYNFVLICRLAVMACLLCLPSETLEERLLKHTYGFSKATGALRCVQHQSTHSRGFFFFLFCLSSTKNAFTKQYVSMRNELRVCSCISNDCRLILLSSSRIRSDFVCASQS